MKNLSGNDTSQYVTTVGTTGAELFSVFTRLPTRDGFTFDGEKYTAALAQKNYPQFTSGYGDFFPQSGVVPGRLVWVGKQVAPETGNILDFDDDLVWINFLSHPE